MSKEHIFPDWLGSMVHRTPTEQHRRGAAQGEDEVFNLVERNGKAMTTKLRIVCRACNGGWMSGIEASTKPLLLRLMKGEPTRLTFEHQRQIATWMTLKTMLIDRADPANSVIPQKERSMLLADRTPQSRWNIWIGRSEMAFGQCGFIAASTASWIYRTDTLEKISPENPDDPNTLSVAIFSRHFLGVAVRWPFTQRQAHFRHFSGEQILQAVWPYNSLALRN